MGLVSEIACTAKVPVQALSGAELIKASDMEAFLNAAEKLQIAIVGIEGFRIVGSDLVPNMNAIADFSEVARDKNWCLQTVSEARRFMVRVPKGNLWFEIAAVRPIQI